MNRLVIIFVLIFCFSCKNEKQDSPIFDTDYKTIVPKDSIVFHKRTEIDEETKVLDGMPIPQFIEFANEIELGRWKCDTARAKKVYGLGKDSSGKIVFFDSKPFYKFTFENTTVGRISKIDYFKDKLEGFNVEVFEKAKSVWMYFYRDDIDDNWIEDGIVEQWEFESNELAIIAYNDIRKKSPQVFFFNTTPYFYQFNNYLFIFHTRAMAFSYDQKKVFEDFKSILKE